jgi:RNA-directed DNA polymerase
MSIYTYKNLYAAYLDCRMQKRGTINALKFELYLEKYLKELLDELKSGAYAPGRSICFVVTEPCPREIFAADFRDRIVHHLLVRELIDIAEKIFVFDSYACRPGKGTHRAVSRVFDYSRMVQRDFRKNSIDSDGPWYIKIDISSFFMTIDKDILYKAVLDLIDRHKKTNAWKIEMADLAEKIIFYCPQHDYVRKGNPDLSKLVPSHKSLIGKANNKGLPIGNFSSQFFANLYMNSTDHFVKRVLKCKYYSRYVDDLIFFDVKREKLKRYLKKTDCFLVNNFSLKLNAKKTKIIKVKKGIDFLGYYIKHNQIFARKIVKNRYKNKLYPLAIGTNRMSWPKLNSIAASYVGHLSYFRL